jgi:photosynthetic reaction center H subunit
MPNGAITEYIDVAQLALYAFWIFFAGLIFYLRREDKREGYPLQSDDRRQVAVQGFPNAPGPKTFRLHGGRTTTVPNVKADRPDAPVAPINVWPGTPMEPIGDPMRDGVGPASYANREDVPEYTTAGVPSIVPLRILTDTAIEENDPDPRGMQVVGADGVFAGTVHDVWVDRAEALIRYLEVNVATPTGPRSALLPITMARVSRRRRNVRVRSILASQFADVPSTANPEQVTKREEDRIVAYYAGGTLYATPTRLGPAL